MVSESKQNVENTKKKLIMHTGPGRSEGEGEGWRDGAGRRKVARGAGIRGCCQVR